MSLKLLVATALAATAAVDDTIFDASIKAEAAANALEDLQKYLDAAPKTAAELVDGCLQYKCTARFIQLVGPRYFFSRAELEEFAQTAFAAGKAHGYAMTEPKTAYAKDGPKYGYDVGVCEPVHDYKAEGSTAAAQQATSSVESAPAATPIRTSEAAVDLQFSDGTCVTVRVAGK